MAVQKIQIDNVACPIVMNEGFIIIAARNYPDPETTEVVLGVRPSLREYATWMRVRGNEYYHGHYYTANAFENACLDFQHRV